MSKDTSLGLVLWIDQNTFATNLIERAFKARNLPFYTIAQVHDFSYLISDLNPSLIVVDAKTALENLESFRSQYEESSQFNNKPVVIVDNRPGLEFLQHKVAELQRPFDPFVLPETLESIQKRS